MTTSGFRNERCFRAGPTGPAPTLARCPPRSAKPSHRSSTSRSSPTSWTMLEEAPTLEDPAEVEHLAATLLAPLEQPKDPLLEVGFAVVEAIAARRDADAAGVLAALAMLAAEPIAGHARTQRAATRLRGDRLARRGGRRNARRPRSSADPEQGRRAAGRAARTPGCGRGFRRRSSASSMKAPAARSLTAP